MNTSVTGSKGTGGRWRGGARRPSATRMSGRGSAPASSPGLPRLSHGSDSRRRARHGGTALPGFQALPPSSSRRTHHDRHRTLRGAHPAVRPAARRSGLGERAGQLHRRRALSGHPTAARDRCPRLVTTRLLGAPLLIAAWELPLGGYLLVRGFGPDAVAALPPPGGTR